MDKKLGGLLAVFFLLFTVFASTILFNGQLSSITRAKEDFTPSATTSLLFAYPLLVKADGVTKSTISVFVRSDKGMPVKDKKITISSSIGILDGATATTDDKGKASINLTSSRAGSAVITALIDGSLKITQPLTVTFE